MKKRSTKTNCKGSATSQHQLVPETRQQFIVSLKTLYKRKPVTEYLLSLSSITSQTAMLSNLQRVARLLKLPLMEIRWEELSVRDVESLLARMRREGLAPSTINATLTAIRGVARQSWRLGLMEAVNYLRISGLKGDPGGSAARGRLLTYKELVLLLDSCADDSNAALGDRDAALLALIASVGLRTNEIVKLNVTDYDPSTKSLHVRGTGSKERQHKVGDTGARHALRAWLKRRGSASGRFLCPVNKEGMVILKEMSATGIYKAVRLRASKAGVVALSPTDLRQTFASD